MVLHQNQKIISVLGECLLGSPWLMISTLLRINLIFKKLTHKFELGSFKGEKRQGIYVAGESSHTSGALEIIIALGSKDVEVPKDALNVLIAHWGGPSVSALWVSIRG